ncbi:MAG: SDR family oxidoreductase [Clostridium sp.]|nr:SDR family oxidoreductase [Clostridium sp.]
MNNSNLFDLRGRTAVVTGASSGIGVQMAKALARQGSNLVILARRKEKLEAVARQIEELGVKCIPVVCDITDIEAIKNAVGITQKKFKTVDILVNNAGVGASAPAEETSDEMWYNTVNIDLNATFMVAREFGKLMIEHGYGRIINIASMYGMVGNMVHPSTAYHAAKGGVVNMTRGLAAEWAKNGITVNSICPGYFMSELTGDILNTDEFSNYIKASVPVGRYGNEGELDSTVVYLASESSSYITGTIIPVDGGYTCI